MHQKSAYDIHQLFRKGDLSAEEIARRTFERIHLHDGELNTFLSLFEERALERARQLDKKRKRGGALGKLAGVPIALKDNIQVKGQRTTCGSKMLQSYHSPYNATVTQLFDEADALLIGKTNMDEFAMGGSGTHSAFAITRNPWNLDCNPGGSSSGSSAAVAARLCPVAMGSDTGGSIRQPAAYTGITGFKPTYGRVSRYGLVAFASSLDQIGPLTQDVRDAAMVMEVIGRRCPRDSTSINSGPHAYLTEIETPIEKLRIGVPWNFLKRLDNESKQNFEDAVAVLKALGTTVVDIDLSHLKYGIAVYYILATAEASTNLARFDGISYGLRSKAADSLDEIYALSREDGFGWEVKNRILLGTYILSALSHEAYYTKAQRVRTLIIRQMEAAFQGCDIIAHPVTPAAAPKLDAIKNPIDEYLQDLYTVGANLTGSPALSVPSGFTSSGMPLGIQFLGPQREDAKVLRVGHAFQMATKHLRSPPRYGGEA